MDGNLTPHAVDTLLRELARRLHGSGTTAGNRIVGSAVELHGCPTWNHRQLSSSGQRNLQGATLGWTAIRPSATTVVLSTQSLRDARDHLSEVIDRVEHQHERVVVTRNGKSAAVILSPEDLAQLQETIDVLSDPRALAEIRQADAAYARGDVVRGTDAVRRLRS